MRKVSSLVSGVWGLLAVFVALMSGVFSILREGYELYVGHVPARTIFSSTVLIAFVVSALIAWYREHLKVAEETAKVEAYKQEWEPQFHFSINDLDPTTGTGEVRASPGESLALCATVINYGRSAMAIRGFLSKPNGGIGVISNIEPLPLAPGQRQQFQLSLEPLISSLLVCNQIPHDSEAQEWRGKVSLALWYEANRQTLRSPEQFFEAQINRGRLVRFRQMTSVEFKYLERVSLRPEQ